MTGGGAVQLKPWSNRQKNWEFMVDTERLEDLRCTLPSLRKLDNAYPCPTYLSTQLMDEDGCRIDILKPQFANRKVAL
jgi:hypothetical protein